MRLFTTILLKHLLVIVLHLQLTFSIRRLEKKQKHEKLEI